MLRYLQNPAVLFSKKPDEEGDNDSAPKGFEKFFRNRNDRKKADESSQKSDDDSKNEKSTSE